MVTTEAEPGLDRIHDRMPVVLDPDRWAAWLDPALTDPSAIGELLEPPAAGRFLLRAGGHDGEQRQQQRARAGRPLPVDELVGVVDPLTGELLGRAEEQQALDV